ncbi:MAG TPA: PTS sugar transporter subunit IIB [Erysipelotrichaceae bacterium]|nr:PTS sugar transporter subunit IIB [Erysipelotrichaceae bacterium]
MIKIRLFCAAGFSTSMLVKKMNEAALADGIEVDIQACSQTKLMDNIKGIDVALLGPQIAYTLAKSKQLCDEVNVPIDVIPMRDYGTLNGKAVLDFALNLIEEAK